MYIFLECDCGTRGKCLFSRSANGKFEKKCVCDKGYAEKDGFCTGMNNEIKVVPKTINISAQIY